MYTSFFGLNEKPFSITPDPRYLFLSERHGEALAHLVYGVTDSGGFVQLTGEVGTGKTTLVRTLLQNRLPDNAEVAVVLNPQLSAAEFLETICAELGCDYDEGTGSIKSLIDALNNYLLTSHAEGRRTVLVVDEAQNLSRDVLEQVRLLTNLETSKQKLLQIILIGQPELRDLLARNDLRQLAQRITGRYHLEPLSRDETAEYIEHRLQVAGAVGEIFDRGAKRDVYRLSKGVPRLINVICDRALLGAYTRESRRVTRRIVRRAAAEISGRAYEPVWVRWATPVMIVVGLGLVAFGLGSVVNDRHVEPPAPATADTVRAPAAVNEAPGERVAAAGVEGDPVRAAPLLAEDEPAAETLPVAEDVEPASESLDAQLMLAADLTSRDDALAALLGIWDIEPAAGVDGCARAEQQGYECLAQRGSWNSLRQLDRPAILTLTDSRGDSHATVLKAIQGDYALLSIGGVEVSHAIDDISALWFGEYLLVWRPVSGQSLALGPGSRGPAVTWLRQSLAAIDPGYRAEPLDSDVYDGGLEARVRDFQRDHRLLVDGLAGRQTQIIINSLLAGDDVPRLMTPRLARD
jgi:general secretion pathway protein A